MSTVRSWQSVYNAAKNGEEIIPVIEEPIPAVPVVTIQQIPEAGKGYRVKWPRVTNAASYKLEVSLDSGNLWQPTSTTDLLYEHISPAPGQYLYRVSSCNNVQRCSSPSVVQSIVIPGSTTKKIIFIHTDLLGSPVAETDENGEVR